MIKKLFLLLALTGPFAVAVAQPAESDDDIAWGEYLTRIGNCAGCHTATGGEAFAGGRPVESQFGTFFTPNITADPETGIGNWTQEQFWRALHEGKRADGKAMYPACPYPNFTRVQRSDVDAIYAYLRTVPAVKQENREHDLDFVASMRSLVSVWQALFFKPGVYEIDSGHDGRWNRGAYLVEGLAHCNACHSERNAFGASRAGDNAPGARIREWYAPSLYSSEEADLQGWPVEKGAELLRTGKADDASTMGPMADVVYHSLQYLTEEDALAMAEYLHLLPNQQVESTVRLLSVSKPRLETMQAAGGKIYEESCQDCHGAEGEGSIAAPALAGNRAVLMRDPTNVVNIIREGGYPPATAGNPRPFGMPPFSHLSVEELAAVVTYIRTSWGNDAPPVSTANVR